jgi:hypothetical protein
VNCDVICFIALDEILGFFFGSVVDVAFEFHIGKHFRHDSAANSTCLRVPFDVIACLKAVDIFQSLSNGRCTPPTNGQEKSTVNDAFNIMRNIVF